jgi:hypothetical protein
LFLSISINGYPKRKPERPDHPAPPKFRYNRKDRVSERRKEKIAPQKNIAGKIKTA